MADDKDAPSHENKGEKSKGNKGKKKGKNRGQNTGGDSCCESNNCAPATGVIFNMTTFKRHPYTITS